MILHLDHKSKFKNCYFNQYDLAFIMKTAANTINRRIFSLLMYFGTRFPFQLNFVHYQYNLYIQQEHLQIENCKSLQINVSKIKNRNR